VSRSARTMRRRQVVCQRRAFVKEARRWITQQLALYDNFERAWSRDYTPMTAEDRRHLNNMREAIRSYDDGAINEAKHVFMRHFSRRVEEEKAKIARAA
jgi:hypothetical protein